MAPEDAASWATSGESSNSCPLAEDPGEDFDEIEIAVGCASDIQYLLVPEPGIIPGDVLLGPTLTIDVGTITFIDAVEGGTQNGEPRVNLFGAQRYSHRCGNDVQTVECNWSPQVELTEQSKVTVELKDVDSINDDEVDIHDENTAKGNKMVVVAFGTSGWTAASLDCTSVSWGSWCTLSGDDVGGPADDDDGSIALRSTGNNDDLLGG